MWFIAGRAWPSSWSNLWFYLSKMQPVYSTCPEPGRCCRQPLWFTALTLISGPLTIKRKKGGRGGSWIKLFQKINPIKLQGEKKNEIMTIFQEETIFFPRYLGIYVSWHFLNLQKKVVKVLIECPERKETTRETRSIKTRVDINSKSFPFQGLLIPK